MSIVLSTYNRGPLLAGALDNLLDQQPLLTPAYEVLVVDNNSTDGTRPLVEAYARRDARIRYLVERKQGLSHARNAGIAAARAPLVTFTDDDVRADRDWVASIVRAFAEFPDAQFAGGKVLPDWPTPPPPWLTREHWAPLALADYGDGPLRVDVANPICLVGANLTVRRAVFDEIGGFEPSLQRVKNGIGSLEDHDFLLRVVRTGRHGVYDPRIVIHAAVQGDRLDRAYHRRWHFGHGHFHAMLRSPHMERSTLGTFYGVPAHLYRQAVRDAAGWIAAWASLNDRRAFGHEVRLRFFAGFVRMRGRQFRSDPARSVRAELAAIVRAIAAGVSRTRHARRAHAAGAPR